MAEHLPKACKPSGFIFNTAKSQNTNCNKKAPQHNRSKFKLDDVCEIK